MFFKKSSSYASLSASSPCHDLQWECNWFLVGQRGGGLKLKENHLAVSEWSLVAG